jgi:hypothetical protein
MNEDNEVEGLTFERDFMWPANTTPDNCYKWISVERLKELFVELRKRRSKHDDTVHWDDIDGLFNPLVPHD